MVRPRIIGISGHRPNRLAPHRIPMLEAEVGDVLDKLGAAAGAPLSLISSLAEGADQIVADAAVQRRMELICPLPFAVDEYVKDFEKPASVENFNSLLREAREIAILPGQRSDGGIAYAAAAEWMLARVSILLVIWDGGTSAGAGGTRDTLDKALAKDIPVLWLHAKIEQEPRLLRSREDGSGAAEWTSRSLISTQDYQNIFRSKS